MRTLKKSLALVLALVMVLGLGVVGASADNKLDSYTDAGKIGDAYVEAVGVLTGLGIVDGRTDTEIVPEATYNRAEAAKIIAYMLLGKDQADALKATVAPFEDVSVDFWAAGYIAYCAELGIISGMTETTFEPYGTLTGYQWAKMLLVAVGYGKNGEFEGDSWSLNTATVVAKTGLNEGDLAAADHVALRREQAMLFAFNALNLKQVTYSPNSTNYVYDIWGYVFADGTGTTLGEEVYDLAMVEGTVVDNEAMGASATYVDPVNKWAKEVKVDADTGLDLMYHAVRVWYVDGKTNTAVYVNDLATVESTTCPTAKQVADTKSPVYVGEIGTAYQIDVVDNSALDLGKTNVIFKADLGQYGYADPVSKTTYVTSVIEAVNNAAVKTTVATDDVATDVSKIDYKDLVVYLLADSTREADAEALHIQAVTVTSGVVSKFDQSGTKFSVTLDDGTVLAESVFHDLADLDNIDRFVVGQVYNFVLDTHGDVIYATIDGARSLYVYTDEWKMDGEYGDISSDRVRLDRFLNVTTGEEYWAPVTWTSGAWPYTGADRGQYFDISATTNSDGDYVAELVTIGENTYANGYIVSNWDFIRSDSDSTVYWDSDENRFEDVYFDADTVTVLVATGEGRNMSVDTYVGIDAVKEHYGVAADGSINFVNAALTVSETRTGDYAASVIFVLAENLWTTSNYVFIPEDINAADWNVVEGDPSTYIVTYNNAYLNGVQFPIKIDWSNYFNNMGWNNTLDRGFYTLHVTYSVNGTPTYWLDERVDNVDGTCYYTNVTFADTANPTTGAWYLLGNGTRYQARESEVTIVDFTNHNVDSIYDAYQWYNEHVVSLAFTVGANGRVNTIYVIDAGWDAKVTFTLTDALKNAGWVIKSINGVDVKSATSVTYTDAAAESLVDNPTVVLYNKHLDELNYSTNTTTYDVAVNDDVDFADVKLSADGTVSFKVTVNSMVLGEKDNDFEIGGLVIGDVTVKSNDDTKVKVKTATSEYKNVVLGTELKVELTPYAGVFENNGEPVDADEYTWTGTYTDKGAEGAAIGNVRDLTGTLSANGKIVTTYITPILDGDAVITPVKWVPTPNPVD